MAPVAASESSPCSRCSGACQFALAPQSSSLCHFLTHKKVQSACVKGKAFAPTDTCQACFKVAYTPFRNCPSMRKRQMYHGYHAVLKHLILYISYCDTPFLTSASRCTCVRLHKSCKEICTSLNHPGASALCARTCGQWFCFLSRSLQSHVRKMLEQ